LGHGVQIGQQAQRAAQEFAMHQARLQAEQQRLQQQEQQEQAALEFKQRQLEQQGLIDQQKLEVQKAYNEQRGMLRADAIKQVQEKVQLAAQQAARKFQAQQQYRASLGKIAELEQSGAMTPQQADKARRQVTVALAPELGVPLSTIDRLTQPEFAAKVEMVKGPDGKMYPVLHNSPNRVQLLEKPTTPTRTTVGPMGVTRSGVSTDPAMIKAEADYNAANAPAPAVPSAGKSIANRILSALGVESTPQAGATNAPPATAAAPAAAAAAPAAASPAAPQGKAKLFFNPKTKKIESVEQAADMADWEDLMTSGTPSTTGEQTDLMSNEDLNLLGLGEYDEENPPPDQEEE
jgi:hypothetical protein